MRPEEQEGLKAPASDMLLNMVMSQPEVEAIKSELNRNFDGVRVLAGKRSFI